MADDGQGFRQGGDGLVRAGQGQRLQVGSVEVAHATLAASQPLQGGVVEDHGLAVRRQLHVELDAVVVLTGQLERLQRVFRRPARRPQAAMGDGWLEQQVPGFSEFVSHETSTTASTSTAKFRGRR